MCDGKNRLKAGGGHGSLTEGKGEPTPETEPIFLAGENWRVFEINILIILHAFHHSFEGASKFASYPRGMVIAGQLAHYQ